MPLETRRRFFAQGAVIAFVARGGGVNDDVDRTMTFRGLADRSFHRGAIGDVGVQRNVDERYLRLARAREMLRRGGAEAARSAGDEHVRAVGDALNRLEGERLEAFDPAVTAA